MPYAAQAYAAQPAARPAAPAVPPVRVVRGGRYGLRRAQRLARRLLWACVGALALVMIVAVVYSQAQVTRLSGQIEKTNRELTNAQSTYDYLSDTMGNITSSTNVQQIAEGRLGLVRADASQVTYIKLHEQSVVERAGTGLEQIWQYFSGGALSLLAQLDP